MESYMGDHVGGGDVVVEYQNEGDFADPLPEVVDQGYDINNQQ